MKKLEDHIKAQNETTKKQEKKEKGKEKTVYYMPIKMDREEAIEGKRRFIEGSFFGRPVNKVKLGAVEDVWVPYAYLVYEYEVGKKGSKIVGNRSGKLHIIYDMNEQHCIQYDDKEEGLLPIKKKDFSDNDVPVVEVEKKKEKIEEIVEDYIHRKIMYKTFAQKGRIKCVKHIEFYRPAVMMEVFFKEKNRNIRFAYLDSYAVKSEHILGMKYRITH